LSENKLLPTIDSLHKETNQHYVLRKLKLFVEAIRKFISPIPSAVLYADKKVQPITWPSAALRCSQKTGDIGKSFHSAESLICFFAVLLGCVKWH